MIHNEICFGFHKIHTKSDEKVFHVGGLRCLDLLVVCSWSAAIYTSPTPCFELHLQFSTARHESLPTQPANGAQSANQTLSAVLTGHICKMGDCKSLVIFCWHSLSICFKSHMQLSHNKWKNNERQYWFIRLFELGMSWTLNKRSQIGQQAILEFVRFISCC